LIVFQAELYDLSHSSHERVQILGLGVATTQGGNGGDVVIFFIALDNDSEFALLFHLQNFSMGSTRGCVPLGD